MAYKIINPETINKSMMGNPKMVKQFIEMYIEQSPIDFQLLTNSLNNNNTTAIRDNAHHIKPTMEYIGATMLREAFQELENMGRDGVEMSIIRSRFREIKSNFDLMIEELKKFILENEERIKD